MTIATKLAFVFFCWACGLAAPWPVQAAVLTILLLLVTRTSGWRPASHDGVRALTGFLMTLALMCIVIFLLNSAVFHRSDQLMPVGPFNVDREGLVFAGRLCLRLCLLSISILSFFLSIRLRSLVENLESAGIPPVISMVALLSLHYLETLPGRVSRVFTAQEARGAPVRANLLARAKALLALLSPLVISSIVETVERSHALELRGFYRRTASDMSALRPSTRLSPSAVLFVLLGILIFLWRILDWLGMLT